MKDFWYDKVEVSVFLCGEDSTEVRQLRRWRGHPGASASRSATTSRPCPRSSRSTTSPSERPTTASRSSSRTPPSSRTSPPTRCRSPIRIKLADPEQFHVVRTGFIGRPGVEQVDDQRALLEPFFNALDRMQVFAFGIAVVQLIAAGLLIANTIRVAAFNRRRETGIMRLVGASSFSIQLPFLLEGVIAGSSAGCCLRRAWWRSSSWSSRTNWLPS